MTVTIPYKRAIANIAASQTDGAVIAAVTGFALRVHKVVLVCGATATTLVFNTKPAGAGTAISPLFANAVNGGLVLPFDQYGWFETNISEGLTVTTGTGATTGIMIMYEEIA